MERDILTNIQTERQRLLKKREALLDGFTKAATVGKARRLSELLIKICQTNEFLKSLEEIEKASPPAIPGRRRYAVSSLFLHESF